MRGELPAALAFSLVFCLLSMLDMEKDVKEFWAFLVVAVSGDLAGGGEGVPQVITYLEDLRMGSTTVAVESDDNFSFLSNLGDTLIIFNERKLYNFGGQFLNAVHWNVCCHFESSFEVSK